MEVKGHHELLIYVIGGKHGDFQKQLLILARKQVMMEHLPARVTSA